MTTTDAAARGSLRILAIHRYYWPDVAPYGVLLRSIARRLARDGYRVEVLSTQPSYRINSKDTRRPDVEHEDGVRIRRISLFQEQGRGTLVRIFNMLGWAISLFAYIIRRRPFDVILIGTTPPVIAAAAASLAARIISARLIYHCMDIHPEIGRITGEFHNPLLYRMLRRIDTTTCRRAHRVVVLSADMQQAVSTRPGASRSNVQVINNFQISGDDETVAGYPIELTRTNRRLRIIFTGNIGRFQGLETVVEALETLDTRNNWEMIFVGDGSALKSLRARAGELDGNNIIFVPHQPIKIVKAAIRESDICLVSLAPQISRYAYPSKIMTYLGQGRPILACVEPESELANLLLREQIGIVVPPADSSALARVIGELAVDAKKRADLQIRAAEIGRRLFDEESTLDEWSRMMSEL